MAEKKKKPAKRIAKSPLTVAEFERMVRRWAGNRAALVLSIGPAPEITVAVTTADGTSISRAPGLADVYEAIHAAMIEAAVDAALMSDDLGEGKIQ